MSLKKSLGLLDVFCIAAGVMISSGIFILPGIAFAKTGPSVFVSYVLAGAAALCGVLSIIELSTAMPRAGGDYYFITRSFGPLMGVIAGFFSWFSLSLKSAFAIFGIAEILHAFTGCPVLGCAVGIALCFVVLNVLGVDIAATFENIIVIALLVIIGMYIIAGMTSIRIDRFIEFAPQGIHSIFFTAGFVFVSFGGLLKVASLSEEVHDPKKTIPAGIIGAVVVVTALYALLLIVLVGTVEGEALMNSLTPVADSANTFMGPTGFILISIASLLAFVSTANAGIMSASRYPMGLSRDKLLPRFLSATNARFGTPVIAIGITGLVIIASLFLHLELLVKIASTIIIFSYILTNISVIIIRESRIQNYMPAFRAPLYPWLQIIAIVLFIFLLVEVGISSLEVVAVIVALGIGVYLLYGRKHYHREFALQYLVERVINKQITAHGLEDELRKVLHQRDDVVMDRFHDLVERSLVLDFDSPMDKHELFRYVAEEAGARLHIESGTLKKLLDEREKESSTALTPFVAIPHIIVEGENLFALCLVRNKKGITFSEHFDAVHAVFVLIGSRDERQFHLQALSAIAQITQHPRFPQRWLHARHEKSLRDICLLTKRTPIE